MCYGVKSWEGESRAVDELFEKTQYSFKMKTIRYNNIRASYIIKE